MSLLLLIVVSLATVLGVGSAVLITALIGAGQIGRYWSHRND